MVLESRLIPLSEPEAWSAALEGLPHSFAHTHAYTAAQAEASGEETFLYTGRARGFQVACPLSFRAFRDTRDAVSPYGFSGFSWRGEYAGFAQAFHDFMQREGLVAGYLVQHPLQDATALTLPEERAHGKQCFLWDLTRSPEQMMAGMASDHRSRLRQWWKQEPRLDYDPPALRNAFLRLYPEAMERAGAKPSYFFGDTALARLSGGEGALLVGAGKDDAIEAVSLFLYQGDYAEYYLNACTEEGRRHARGLVWEAGQRLKTLGVSVLNLGCGITEGDALEEFKQRFGTRAQRFQIFRQVYRPEDYSALCVASGVDAADRNGFFPAYRRPRV